jgi:hypothetical protein
VVSRGVAESKVTARHTFVMKQARTYKPVRDRGVYRAAANPRSVNHAWATELVNGLRDKAGGALMAGLLAWCCRDRGREDFIAALVYKENPFLSLIKKDGGFSGGYVPVPLKTE